MKKINIYHATLPVILLSAFLLFSFIEQNGITSNDTARNTNFVEPVKFISTVNYFNEGQVLLPDYAIPDTLIVRDAKGLNEAMILIEQGIIESSDSELDNTFHLYCTVK